MFLITVPCFIFFHAQNIAPVSYTHLDVYKRQAYNDAEMAVLSQEMPGAKVNRYKGLGEMNPEQLWETTMNPDNRVIVQITIDAVSYTHLDVYKRQAWPIFLVAVRPTRVFLLRVLSTYITRPGFT